MAKKIIHIPDLGEAEDVEVIEICAKVGDQVDTEDPIIVLESDKAAMEIPASEAGKIISIDVSIGDSVNSGSPFLQIEVLNNSDQKVEEDSSKNESNEGLTASKEPGNIETEPVVILEKQQIPSLSSTFNNSNIYAGPAVRKLAREFGIDLSLVQPSGPKNRIQKEDLHLFVKSRLSLTPANNSFEFSQPDIDYSKWGPVQEQKLSKFQKSSL
ncbi:MAG: dihydrolipoyllysine acetyltransferase, partial [Proteobacteria bacterium]|nr:dihydrolipoyllysine acetyltransferase [Pseudomonadota bacterium]